MIQWLLAIWSLVPLPFSKSNLNIWKFTVHILLKPGLENFDHYFASMWDECNYAVVWTFFGIAFLWDWNENWPFLGLWPLLYFPNSVTYWLHRLVGFDYRTSTWLGKQTLGGHNQTLCTLRGRRKEQCLHRKLNQTCLWESRSLQQSCGLTAACWGVRSTEYNSVEDSHSEGVLHWHHYPYHSLPSG